MPTDTNLGDSEMLREAMRRADLPEAKPVIREPATTEVAMRAKLDEELRNRSGLPSSQIKRMRDQAEKTIEELSRQLENYEAYKTVKLQEISDASEKDIDHCQESVAYHQREIERLREEISQRRDERNRKIQIMTEALDGEISSLRLMISTQEGLLGTLAKDVTPTGS